MRWVIVYGKRITRRRKVDGGETDRLIHRCWAGLAAVLGVGMLMLAPASGQTPHHSSWQKRTPDGQPDIEGYWSNATITPFERPAALGG